MIARKVKNRTKRQGFTLAEVLVALVILGGGTFTLMSAHFAALGLHSFTQEAVDGRQLLESIVGRAEMAIAVEELSGGGDFGPRYQGYSWTYEAEQIGNTDSPFTMDTAFYHVRAALSAPDGKEQTLEFYTFINPEMQSVQVSQ